MDNIVKTQQHIKPGLVHFGDAGRTSRGASETLINTTPMAKSFGKRTTDWLRLSATKRFLAHLAEIKNRPITDLVVNIKRNAQDNREKGTWIHEDAALEFARWLSPSFAIWNNQRTKELLLTGKTETAQETEALPVVVYDLLHKVEALEDVMNEQARKAVYHDAVLQSRTLIPANVIAKELGMSAMAMNKLLHEKKIIYKSDNHWVLYAGYQGKGYTGTKTVLYIDSQGRYQSTIHTYWTEKGREFVHTMVKETKRIA